MQVAEELARTLSTYLTNYFKAWVKEEEQAEAAAEEAGGGCQQALNRCLPTWAGPEAGSSSSSNGQPTDPQRSRCAINTPPSHLPPIARDEGGPF